MIEETLKDTIRSYDLLKRNDKLLLGVSGGPDSMCLLKVFSRLKDEYKLKLVCVHFNHGLRPSADKEEAFVHNFCKKEGIKFISEKKDVRKFFKGDSLEQTARNLRFDFFLKCSREVKIKKIALGHHKDDLVETVLMRLIRGTGLRGLRGFLPKSKYKSLTVIRPLIEIEKSKILDWLKREKVSYCLDESNLEDKFLRNKIRLNLFPLLKELNPNIAQNLYNLSRSISLDYDFIYAASFDVFNSLKRRHSAKELCLDLEGLKKLSPAVFNHLMRIAIEELKGDVRRIEGRHLEEIRDLVLKRPSGSIVDLPSLLVKKEQNLLRIQILIL
ncbi:MAG: tRNA lysidine(34) synthetase TilS [Candidatus Omnitrophota bacterium]|nr:MAG: tRNA lysidine(34) synthetase TilS [Candidatus Omnitrophota bacterium]